jgi:hypothetical protein
MKRRAEAAMRAALAVRTVGSTRLATANGQATNRLSEL